MAWQQSDLDTLDVAIARGVKAVTYADGRRIEYPTLDEMRRLRIDMKNEIAQAAVTTPRVRSTVGRMRR